jgi:hypothetical protein
MDQREEPLDDSVELIDRESIIERRIEPCRDLQLMMDYFKELTKHPDLAVQRAAKACMEVYGTPRWRSRTMRNLLGDLSWALADYLERKEDEEKELNPF